MPDLIDVLTTPSAVEARLTASALQSAGLHATVHEEGMAGTLGAGRLEFPCRVKVPAHERARAYEVLAALESADGERADPDQCPNCGATWEPGFDVCWNCGPGVADDDTSSSAEAPRSSHLEIRVDGVTAQLPRVPSKVDMWALGGSAGFTGLGFLGVFAGIDLLTLGLLIGPGLFLVARLGFLQRIRVDIDAHALTVDGERFLWEEIATVYLGRYRLRWSFHTGGTREVALILAPQDRRVLADAVRLQQTRERAPRSRDAERDLSALRGRTPAD